MSKKILQLDPVHPAFKNVLEAAGWTITDGLKLTPLQCSDVISQFDGILIKSRFKIDNEILAETGNLKFIARNGVGVEHIDLDLCEKKGIEVITAPEGSRDAVAEHAIGMILMLLNNLHRVNEQVRIGKWIREPNRGIELSERTIGIIGFGNMGSSFAKKLSGFGCRILAYDKYKTGFGSDFVEECSLEKIFSVCDVISLHVPLTEETHYMFDEAFINKFKNEFYLINTSRGKVVKTDDLVQGIIGGKIKGCCLDVLEYETGSFETFYGEGEHAEMPTPLQYLLRSDRVVLSPHIAGWTYESDRKIAQTLAAKINSKY